MRDSFAFDPYHVALEITGSMHFNITVDECTTPIGNRKPVRSNENRREKFQRNFSREKFLSPIVNHIQEWMPLKHAD